MQDEQPANASSVTPRVTVLVRSYRRPKQVAELLAALLEQRHDSFEIVVVEQTPEWSDSELAVLRPLWADPRVRLLRHPPLGGARARNEGIRQARGEIIVFIDDDDLPASPHWIAGHERHYADANLAGLSGRQVRQPGEACPYPRWLRPVARRLCMRFSPLGIPHLSLPRLDEDLQPVDWVNGTNGSVRRSVALAVGLWDESVAALEEHSFGFKFAQRKLPGQYLAWRAEPTIVRRVQFRGGMDKRSGDVRKELETQLNFSHVVVRTYHPQRFQACYPLYLSSALLRTLAFVWDYDWFEAGAAERLRRTRTLLTSFPFVLQRVRDQAGRTAPVPQP